MKLILIIGIIIFSSCSLFEEKLSLEENVQVLSNPSASDVYNVQGDFLGRTPLTLKGELLKKASKENVVSIVLKRANYKPENVVFVNRGVAKVEVGLEEIDSEYFEELLRGRLSKDINKVAKKLVRIQTGIMSGKMAEVRENLSDLIDRYPAISTNYTLQGVLLIREKKYKAAEASLQKALSLDESDDLAKSYLNYIKEKTGN
tara:strand:- start:4961 stop:5569 length:609 start_codon:yes stop_codon:yes gene_type:complete